MGIITCPTITWQSNHPEIATVNNTGLVTGVSNGTATISASNGSISDEINIVVSSILIITSPTINTQWQRGTTKRITWNTSLTSGVVNILYQKGTVLTRITDDAHLVNVLQKYYDWSIPSDIELGEYQIIVATQQAPIITVNSNTFSIIAQSSSGDSGFIPLLALGGIFGIVLVMAALLGKKEKEKVTYAEKYEEYDATTGYETKDYTSTDY